MRGSAFTVGYSILLVVFSLPSISQGQLIVAHRGASQDAPENTLAAFLLAWEQKADAIEGDFYLTVDEQIVAIHDRSTKRTTGIDLPVCDCPIDQLQELDAGSWKSPKFSGECIPTIEQVVASIPDNKIFVLEIKDSPRIVPHLARRFKEDPDFAALIPKRLKIISFSADVIRACKEQIPEATALWLTSFKNQDGRIRPSIDEILKTLEECKADGLDCNASPHIDVSFVEKLRKARADRPYEFHVWTVDDPAIAIRFSSLGVDSITTNRPAMILQELDKQEKPAPK